MEQELVENDGVFTLKNKNTTIGFVRFNELGEVEYISRKTSENTAAPINIKNTIAVISVVLCTTSLKRAILNCPLMAANRVAPKAPTPAASVGVAAPARIEPSTATIRITGGNRLRITLAKL